MRIQELFEAEDKGQSKGRDLDIGMYVALRVEQDDAKTLFNFCEDMEVPKPLDYYLMHMTIYSSEDYDPEFEAVGTLAENVIGENLKLAVWETKEGARALICELECEQAENRFEEIEDEYDMKYMYKEFKPHITLSYDIGEMEFELDKMTYHLRTYLDTVRFDYEYSEALDRDKYKNNGKRNYKK